MNESLEIYKPEYTDTEQILIHEDSNISDNDNNDDQFKPLASTFSPASLLTKFALRAIALRILPKNNTGIEKVIPNDCEIEIFADDIVLWSSGFDIEKVGESVNLALADTRSFAVNHKLSFSSSKSTVGFFTTNRKLQFLTKNLLNSQPGNRETPNAGLGSRSPIGFGLLQGEWTHGPDLVLLISGMRNNNNTFSIRIPLTHSAVGMTSWKPMKTQKNGNYALDGEGPHLTSTAVDFMKRWSTADA
ncbi:hypothetical protein TNCV_222091 [Trichonephila clavipes]|nr:hypothetical protein TNCV_222091 [Trichonephila clavipes]